jgi:galactokinase
MTDLQQKIAKAFEDKFHAKPTHIVRAPGRVNLIGEHTDYNDGFVMPMAIDRAVWMALRPREDDRVIVHSLEYDKTTDFSLSHFEKAKEKWSEHIKGVAWALQDAGHKLRGWEGVRDSDVPIGAGLSSSAALELATARAFGAVSGFKWNAIEMAKLGQRAENKWVGVNCGIMDQTISAAGKDGHALLLDCRSLEYQLVPLPAATSVIILDTTTRRGLVDSAYNERRSQCEAAAKFFGVKALRDVSSAQFESRAGQLDEMTRRRARHVITENERTVNAAAAMRAGDATLLGKLMNESHESLRHDFEVTNEALNVIVDCARKAPGCFGARMTGAGFGGCAVALVESRQAEAFVRQVSTTYEQSTKLRPQIYICRSTNGAELV